MITQTSSLEHLYTEVQYPMWPPLERDKLCKWLAHPLRYGLTVLSSLHLQIWHREGNAASEDPASMSLATIIELPHLRQLKLEIISYNVTKWPHQFLSSFVCASLEKIDLIIQPQSTGSRAASISKSIAKAFDDEYSAAHPFMAKNDNAARHFPKVKQLHAKVPPFPQIIKTLTLFANSPVDTLKVECTHDEDRRTLERFHKLFCEAMSAFQPRTLTIYLGKVHPLLQGDAKNGRLDVSELEHLQIEARHSISTESAQKYPSLNGCLLLEISDSY
jgi:hypothetical protein